jgi:hypothetical protein
MNNNVGRDWDVLAHEFGKRQPSPRPSPVRREREDNGTSGVWALWRAVALGVLAASATLAAAAPVTTVVLRNPGDQPAREAPITFGQVFKKGDLKTGVLARAGRAEVQADVKRNYDDGSVRFAIISLVCPELAAGGQTTVEIRDGREDQLAKPVPVRPGDLLKTDFDAVVTLTFPGGDSRSASARQLLAQAGEKARPWLNGPVVSEWLLEGPLTDKAGAADPDLRVQFQVRAYRGGKSARVSVVVENCLDTWAGNIGYDIVVNLGKEGRPVFEKKGVDHRRLSRWRKVFWWGDQPAELSVIHDFACLAASGALPNYDRSIKVPEATLKQMASDWAASKETDIMGCGSLTKYMPTTGGRPEIGPYPAWAVQYLLTMDPRAKAVVLGNGDLAGSWPIHVRNAKTGRIMTIDERPKFWLDERGQDRPHWQRDRQAPPPPNDPKGRAYVLSPDVAHMGSFAYIPYLVTGDFYHLEEAWFWANYCLLAQWNAPRQDARGLMSDQVRGNAWGLRNIGDAAFIAGDADPEGKYFAEKIHNNMAAMTAKMYGPPEYNSMGFWHPRDVNDARIQNPANPNWMLMVWWEHDYLIWSLHHLTDLGFADAAKPRDFLLRWRVGSFVHPAEFDPRFSAPYRLVIGEMGPDKKVAFYEDWKKLAEENIKFGLKPELPTYGGSYTYSARMAVTCGVDARFPKAEEALQWLNDNLPKVQEAISADPVFALAPREKKP